jgi:hypothetical protein
MHAVHILIRHDVMQHFFNRPVHFNTVLPSTSILLNYLFPSNVQTKILYAFLISVTPATKLAHFAPTDLIATIIFSEEYNYEAPHYPVFSAFL